MKATQVREASRHAQKLVVRAGALKWNHLDAGVSETDRFADHGGGVGGDEDVVAQGKKVGNGIGRIAGVEESGGKRMSIEHRFDRRRSPARGGDQNPVLRKPSEDLLDGSFQRLGVHPEDLVAPADHEGNVAVSGVCLHQPCWNDEVQIDRQR